MQHPLLKPCLIGKWLLGIACYLAATSICYGQEGSVRGRIQDTILEKDCPLSVVAIVDADSSLVKFTRCGRDGRWMIGGIPAGKYLILVSHPYYRDYVGKVTVVPDSTIDLGRIALEPKSDSLAAVVVTPRSPPMHIRGDTLEYNTANVKMKVNATVEELLKRLPGVQVDQNGNIMINGVRVERLLVDGEDFFGGDPTIVTTNFNADMIAKIQFLEKKSSQAEFTGVDDGQRTKTVNMVLKEDAKKGYFVKGEVGAGPGGYNTVNGMLGAFRGVRQLAVLAMEANNGSTGFSGNGAGLSIGGGPGDALGGMAGGGVPQVEGAGAHYADKWNGNEDHASGNASFGFTTIHPYSSSISTQILPDSAYTQTQTSGSENVSNRQRLDADYDYRPDSIQAFRFSVGGDKAAGSNQFASVGSSTFNDTLVNSTQSRIRSTDANDRFNASFMWRIRARKKGARNFSITARMSKESTISNGYLYVLNNFYKPDGSLLNIDTTDQRKSILTSNITWNSNLNVAVPLWRNTVLALRFDVNYNQSQTQQSTFGRGDGKYRQLIDSLSNHYQNNVLNQTATINIQGTGRPLSYTIGGDIRQYSNRQEDVQADSVIKYTYLTLNPRVDARYAVSKNDMIGFNYSANTQQPSIGQLQPVQNNNNPLYITLGNPHLRSSFSQNFGLSYIMLKPVNVTLGLNYNYLGNAISTKVYTDSLGRQISQAVNVSGSRGGGAHLGFNRKVWGGIELGANTNVSFGRSVSYVGDLLSNNDYYNAGGDLSAAKYVADHFSVRVGAGANYSSTSSSVNASLATHFWARSGNFELSWFILPGLELNTNGYYTWQQKTSVFTNNNSTFFWNAFVSRNFLRNRLVISWRINDILGENAGIGRSISGNTTTQSMADVVGRYWLVSVSYRFIRHGRLL